MKHSPARWARMSLSLFLIASASACVSDGRPAEEENALVNIESFLFEPRYLRVELGTEVRWVNGDAIEHTVTSGVPRELGVPGVSKEKREQPDGLFDRDLDGEGSEASVRFDEAGRFSYYCDVHAGMSGTVIVS